MARYVALGLLAAQILPLVSSQNATYSNSTSYPWGSTAGKSKDEFLDGILDQMTVEELAQHLHLFKFTEISDGEGRLAKFNSVVGVRGIGEINFWGAKNATTYNDLQRKVIETSRFPLPILQGGECLRAVLTPGTTIFPASINMAATWSPALVKNTSQAIALEARAIGQGSCYCPVLDLAKEPRWGRIGENFGEDKFLTAQLGWNYVKGLQNDGELSDRKGAIASVKHFLAHGSPEGGRNAGPVHVGKRQLWNEFALPFRDAIQRGGALGIMFAYNTIDGSPAAFDPDLHAALNEWGFDGRIISDDHMIQRSMAWHQVAENSQDAITQYLNAGGMGNYADWGIQEWTRGIVAAINGSTLTVDTLKSRVKGLLKIKYDLGLFDSPYLPDDFTEGKIDTDEAAAIASEVAEKSIVLVKNTGILPLKPKSGKKVALIGPFVDTVNLGGYIRMGVHERMITPRQAIVDTYVDEKDLETHWGAPTFLYYDLNNKAWGVVEGPMLEYEHYPPSGPDGKQLPSNAFSVRWEGYLHSPVDAKAVLGAMTRSGNVTVYVNDVLHSKAASGSVKNTYSDTPDQFWQVYEQNSTMVPTGSAEFTFKKGASIKIRIEYQGSNAASGQRLVAPAWNLVDRKDELEKATRAAREADYVIFIAGGSAVVDQETNDMSTLALSPNQTALADAVFAAGKPVIFVTTGARPLALPEYYRQAAAVLYTGYNGQAGGQAIADILYGKVNPSGRLPIAVPYSVGTSPAYYNHDNAAYRYKYVDIPNRDVDGNQIPNVAYGGGITYNPLYHFGHGLSYTSFNYSQITADKSSFTAEDTITFEFSVTNTGAVAGREVPQIYLLQRVASISQPVKQLVGFTEVDLQPGETQKVSIQLDVNRYLSGYDRWMKWRVEPGTFVFTLQPSSKGDSTNKVTLTLPSS
ncbi:uncharacterized protein H6S33_006102 [Morchella sextelata]|uniref:uncharacterized protein n=1 Tax=Morchella sextelata TaxID=1174677 RepID=UPI001D056928|nr:uncharacterized protein H6S33_006102 [Morchella sextelata]KAH0614216.1 hypothetical protein H6S33_006102 [Morchella sextelata]